MPLMATKVPSNEAGASEDFLTQELLGGLLIDRLPELVVQTGPPDMVEESEAQVPIGGIKVQMRAEVLIKIFTARGPTVTQRAWISWMRPGANGAMPYACPDLLVASQSPSTPNTHPPICQLQPTSKPPVKPLRLKSPVMGRPAL